MKPVVTLLGTGGPRPDISRGASAVLIQVGDDNLLFDAGRGVVRQLVHAGVPPAQINPVFITHHHYDHIGDLHDVILSSWLDGRQGALRIFGPPETRRIVNALVTQVYDKDIEFREQEKYIGGWQPVEVTEVSSGVVVETDRLRITTEQVMHGDPLSFTEAFRSRWLCLGYRIEFAGTVIALSGDTVECDGLYRLAQDADLLVQCCYMAAAELTSEPVRRLARHTLACSDTVGKIATRARAKRLVLTHLRKTSDAMLQSLLADVRRDFAAPVELGHDLLRIEL